MKILSYAAGHGFSALAALLLAASCKETPPSSGPHPPTQTAAKNEEIPARANANTSIPAALLPQRQVFRIHPGRDTALAVGAPGNLLHIPRDCFVDAAGAVVTSPVDLQFREFRNAADMAFSGISMVYQDGAQPQWFNSAGMFEIGGTSNGAPVQIRRGKALKMDYRLAQKSPGTAFFRLGRDGRGWRKISELPGGVKEKPGGGGNAVDVVNGNAGPAAESKVGFVDIPPIGSQIELYWPGDKTLAGMMVERWRVPGKLDQFLRNNPGAFLSFRCVFDTGTGKIVRALPDEANPIRDFNAEVCRLLETLPPFRYRRSGKLGSPFYPRDYAFQLRLIGPGVLPVGQDGADEMPVSAQPVPRNEGTLLAGGADAGHTYPDIVAGLNMDSFGVYNCDQIYRVPNLIAVQASYTDEQGRPITDGYVLSMVDRRYNGAFSFAPAGFQCDGKGDNMLLLFTTSGKLYATVPAQLQKMNLSQGGSYTFPMKDISATATTTNSLAKYLGLKI